MLYLRVLAVILIRCSFLSAWAPPITVIIPSYNNIEWCDENIRSVLNQRYSNYRVIYINDCSTDCTEKAVIKILKEKNIDYSVVDFDSNYSRDTIESSTKAFAKALNKTKSFFILVNNSCRVGSLANLYRAIYSCPDNEIIGIVDGDDWLWDKNVLKQIGTAYQEQEIWLTHGRFIEHPSGHSNWSSEIPSWAIESNQIRCVGRLPSHFKTFYSWLFKKIKLEDLLYEDMFYPMTGDMAIMFPMIEMTGIRHRFISSINYVYNMSNTINDNKINPALQNTLDAHIRGLPIYQPLECFYSETTQKKIIFKYKH